MRCTPTEVLHDLQPKVDDAIELRGVVRRDDRARGGIEIDIASATILNRAGHLLPFTSSSDVSAVGLEILTDYRPLSLRNDHVGDIFRIQAAILRRLRDYLTSQRFTEDCLVRDSIASGTEGGTNLSRSRISIGSPILRKSPQFYEEHGVVGFEARVRNGSRVSGGTACHEPSSARCLARASRSASSMVRGRHQVERELLSYLRQTQ